MTKRQQMIYDSFISKEVGLNLIGLQNVWKAYNTKAVNDSIHGRPVDRVNKDRRIAALQAILHLTQLL